MLVRRLSDVRKPCRHHEVARRDSKKPLLSGTETLHYLHEVLVMVSLRCIDGWTFASVEQNGEGLASTCISHHYAKLS